jgi:phosphoribosyl 1,2-cyclic phosphate phosphodiesterase
VLTLTILGCGTSSGVPRIGGDWGACDPADPRNRRLRASILVESAETRILVDTGPDMRDQLIRAGVGRIDAILWTHDHADHCHGIDDVRQLAQHGNAPVRAYARQQTMDLLKHRFAYAFDGRPGYPPILIGAPLPNATLWIGDIAIDAVDQPHGDIFSTGFRFVSGRSSVGYSTDFHEVTDQMIDLFSGSDIWIADALRERPHPTHAHLALTLAAAERIKPGRTILTHMDNSMDYKTLAASLPIRVEPGYDGQSVILGDGATIRV